MSDNVTILGAGLAGSEAAFQLADRGFRVRLVEMRPGTPTPVHATGACAELVCSNSLKSTKPESAAGMLKAELDALGSHLLAAAHRHAVPAGGALAVDREAFARDVTALIEGHPLVDLVRGEAASLAEEARGADALVVATGPLTSGALAADLARVAGAGHLAFYDAAAPIVMADSLDGERLFRQSRYEDGSDGAGDYLNAPFTREEYEAFAAELVTAERVVLRDFETRELFQACQPIEEIARKGLDAPRFGPLKPVGLTDPRTGRRPWAALQLRAEDAHGTCYNLVGFQTNLTFSEQRRVFRLIPGLEHAEFARFGVMHRNTFLDAPRLLDASLRLTASGAAALGVPASKRRGPSWNVVRPRSTWSTISPPYRKGESASSMPARANSTPMPKGPYILWPENAAKSTPSASRRSDTCAAVCAQSMTVTAPHAWARRTTSSTDSSVPSTLEAWANAISFVRGPTTRSSSPSRKRPHASTSR